MNIRSFSLFDKSLAFLFIIFLFSCSSGKKSEVSEIDEVKVKQLLEKNTCFACHKPNEKLVGPSYQEIASKNYSDERIVALVYKPEPENWPEYPPMIALSHIDKSELLHIARWINSLE